MSIIFVTGGARSGKSTFALEIARASQEPVTFIATAQAFDAEMIERITRHQLERRSLENPNQWVTIEAPTDVKTALENVQTKVVILDCLSLLVSNLMLENNSETQILERIKTMLEIAKIRDLKLIVVSNEVGSGIVPEYPLGRIFRDILGRANQLVAGISSEAYLLVAGLSLRLNPERGLLKARNAGLVMALSENVLYLTDHEIWDESHLERCFDAGRFMPSWLISSVPLGSQVGN